MRKNKTDVQDILMGDSMKKVCMRLMVMIVSLSICCSMTGTQRKNSVSPVILFSSIEQLKRYAQTLPEYPDPDSSDWQNPSFANYYKSRQPGYFKKIANFLGFRGDAWRTTEFKKLLQVVIDVREKAGFNGKFVSAMTPKHETKFVIVAGLHGAFHALVRYLEILKNKNIIDEHFNIIDPNYTIVFDGNAITGSVYGLDTLALILQLMSKNPEHVVYIRGAQEEREHWQQYNIGQELKGLLSASDFEIVKNLINQFVDTLPLALYLVAKRMAESVELVAIGSSGLESGEFEEDSIARYFFDPNVSLIHIDNYEKRGAVGVSVRALIRDEQFSKEKYALTSGLRKTGPENNAIVWSLISGPIGSYRVLYQFFYDAFVILATANELNAWTLTLYNQDVRDPKGITPKKIFNLLTGQESTTPEIQQANARDLLRQKEQLKYYLQVTRDDAKNFELAMAKDIGIKESRVATEARIFKAQELKKEFGLPLKEPADTAQKTIVFGSVMDLSRKLRTVGQRAIVGMELLFDAINRTGGIKGKKINLTVLDDEYDPQKTRERVLSLLDQYKIDTLLMPLGSPTLESYLDLVKAGKVLVLAPLTGSSFFRTPDLKFIVHFRASYAQEGLALARYAVESLGAKKIVLFYQKDVQSTDGVLNYFKKIGFTNYIEVTYSEREVSFEKQISQINQTQADTFIFLSVPSSTLEFIRQMGIANLVGKNLLGWSDLASEAVYNFIKSRGLKFILTSVVPDPALSMLPIVKKYREESDAKKFVYGPDALEGYINASIVAEILKKIDGPITNEKIISVAESFKNFDLGGITLNFDPQSRQLIHDIWLDTGDADWQKISCESTRKMDTQLSKPTGIKSLSIGSTLDLSRGGMLSGKAIDRVAKYMFEQSNKQGLVPGVTLDWVPLDDQYTPAKAVINIEQLLKQNIDIIMAPWGSETFLAIFDFVRSGSILALFPQPGLAGKREPDYVGCIYFRPSFMQEGFVEASYVAEKIEPKKVVLFYQDDAFGRALEIGAKEALENAKILVTSIPYKRNDTNFDSAVSQIKQLAPDCIGLLTTEQAAKIFLQQLSDVLTRKIQFFGSSDLGQAMIRNYMHHNQIKCIVSNVVPNPFTSQLPIVQEFRKDMEKAHISIDAIALETYIGVRLLIEVLKQIEGPVNKESIRKALEKIKNYDFKGLQLNFDPETRQLSNTIWIDPGEGEWIVEKPVVKKIDQQETGVGMPSDTISIGSTLDLSKSDKVMGNLIKNCLEAFFDMINREKILDSRKVEILVLDDEYNVKKARANVQRLIEERKILALLSPMGSLNVEGYLDLVNAGQVDLLFAQGSSIAFRKADQKNIINFSASGLDVGYSMTKYAFKKSAITKLMLFYESTVVGSVVGVTNALSELRTTNLLEVPFSASDVNYSEQAKKIKNENPDAIMLASGMTPALSLIRLLGVNFLMGKILLGASTFLNSDSFKKSIRTQGLTMAIPSLVPNPKTSDLQIVKDFRAFARAAHIEDDPVSLQTYISGRIFVEIIKKIEGPVTKQKIIEVAEQFKDFGLGGISLTFDPQTRRIINNLWIDSGKERWLEEPLGQATAIA